MFVLLTLPDMKETNRRFILNLPLFGAQKCSRFTERVSLACVQKERILQEERQKSTNTEKEIYKFNVDVRRQLYLFIYFFHFLSVAPLVPNTRSRKHT